MNNPALDTDSPNGSSGELRPVGPPRYYVADLNGGHPGPQEQPQAFSVAFVWGAIRQWWKLALPLALLLAAAGGTGVYLAFRPEYQASAWLQIEDTRPYFVFPTNEDSRRFVATQIELMRSPLVLMPVVADPQIAALAVAENEDEDPVGWLAKEIKISSVGQSELFRVSLTSHDPKGSAGVVNAVVKEYLDMQRSNEAQQTETVIKLLEDESQRRAAEVTRLREGLRDLAEEASLKDPLSPNSNSTAVLRTPLGDLQTKLATAQFEQEMLKAQVTALKQSVFGLGDKGTTASNGSATVTLEGDANDFSITPAVDGQAVGGVKITLTSGVTKGNQAGVVFDPEKKSLTIDIDPLATTADTVVETISADGRFQAKLAAEGGQKHDGSGLVCQPHIEVSNAEVERAVANDPQVQSAKAALGGALAKQQELRLKLAKGESDPIYKRFAVEVQEREESLKALQNEVRKRVVAEMTPALVREHTEKLSELQGRLESATLMVTLLEGKRDEQAQNVSESSGDTMDMEFKRTELARAEQVFDLIESRIVKLRTEQRAPARVSRLQDAEVPKRPVEVLPFKQIGLASFAGLCFPFLLAVGWERIVRRVSDPGQLERETHLPVVGEIARMPLGRNLSSSFTSHRIKDQFGLYEESIDSLRTGLVLSEPLKSMKVLAVTSAANNEGKTSISVQLAVSIAKATGEMVLLIDGDMRSPDIHRLLGIRLEPGLTDVLAHQCEPTEAIVNDWGQKVHLMPAGKLCNSPHRLLGNGALRALLSEVSPHYRYVIIDTPPILAASEALVFARAADAAIVCTMRDASRVEQVKKTRDRLQGAGARTVGIVLNGVPVSQYAYRYGNYYAYQRR